MPTRGAGSDKRRARTLHREAIRLGFEISFMDLWTRLDFWEQRIYDTKLARQCDTTGECNEPDHG